MQEMSMKIKLKPGMTIRKPNWHCNNAGSGSVQLTLTKYIEEKSNYMIQKGTIEGTDEDVIILRRLV